MEQLSHARSIGIWGLGVVGRSVICFLRRHFPQCFLTVHDHKTFSSEELLFLRHYNVCITGQTTIDFLDAHEVIIPSPGIDLRNYRAYEPKFVHEVDIFYSYWKKPSIVITGTLGKTTVTTLLSKVLQNNGITALTGGNVGAPSMMPLLDLLQKQEEADYAVLELSSFQLEYATRCAPTIAVLTNLYPNHLDRHDTVTTYLDAKLRIIHAQTQQVIVPHELYPQLRIRFPHHRFTIHAENNVDQIDARDTVITSDAMLREHTTVRSLSYPRNWLIIKAVCDFLSLPFTIPTTLELPEHRLEYIATFGNCAFYDDSKSTLIEATLAATEKLQAFDIILLFGGVSKGVDRLSQLHLFKNKIHQIVCFGKEADALSTAAQKNGIAAHSYKTLEEAFEAACAISSNYKNPVVLFSPGGASYDLFTDYKQRGLYFKRLVHERFNASINASKF